MCVYLWSAHCLSARSTQTPIRPPLGVWGLTLANASDHTSHQRANRLLYFDAVPEPLTDLGGDSPSTIFRFCLCRASGLMRVGLLG